MASGKNVSSSAKPESLEKVIDSLICAKVIATLHVYLPLVSEVTLGCYLCVHYVGLYIWLLGAFHG